MKYKGEAGEHLCTTPYGYRKAPDNPKQWIVDEEASAVVKRIYALCLDRYGPSQIACILKEDKVLIPTAYWQLQEKTVNHSTPNNPYLWVSATVAEILEKKDYLGHMVNFKTYKQSYKSKKNAQSRRKTACV